MSNHIIRCHTLSACTLLIREVRQCSSPSTSGVTGANRAICATNCHYMAKYDDFYVVASISGTYTAFFLPTSLCLTLIDRWKTSSTSTYLATNTLGAMPKLASRSQTFERQPVVVWLGGAAERVAVARAMPMPGQKPGHRYL